MATRESNGFSFSRWIQVQRRSEAHGVLVARGDERAGVAGLVELLDRHEELRLVGPGGEAVLPASVVAVLERSVPELAAGRAVAVTSVDALLTTQEAAELLGVSRPYLARLLDVGEMPSSRAGSHRRVRFDDMVAYKRHRDEERLAVRSSLTEPTVSWYPSHCGSFLPRRSSL